METLSLHEMSQVNGGFLLALLIYSHYNTAGFKAETTYDPDTGTVSTDDGGGKWGPTVLK